VERQWTYLEEALRFIISRVGEVNTVPVLHSAELTGCEYKIGYQLLSPLAMFSLSTEAHEILLADVIPKPNELQSSYGAFLTACKQKKRLGITFLLSWRTCGDRLREAQLRLSSLHLPWTHMGEKSFTYASGIFGPMEKPPTGK
jgi:hypothetical protein